MKHLGEEEQLDIYYEEGSQEAKAHLKACRECSTAYAQFKQTLDSIKPEAIPQKGPEYGDFVWQALRPQLIPYQQKTEKWQGWTWWKTATAAAACLALLTAAFIGGRYWEHRRTTTPEVAGNPQPQQRLVVVVLTDHLDRTERLLVQLNHADS
jgi:anti-sigma-K factor RskA